MVHLRPTSDQLVLPELCLRHPPTKSLVEARLTFPFERLPLSSPFRALRSHRLRGAFNLLSLISLLSQSYLKGLRQQARSHTHHPDLTDLPELPELADIPDLPDITDISDITGITSEGRRQNAADQVSAEARLIGHHGRHQEYQVPKNNSAGKDAVAKYARIERPARMPSRRTKQVNNWSGSRQAEPRLR